MLNSSNIFRITAVHLGFIDVILSKEKTWTLKKTWPKHPAARSSRSKTRFIFTSGKYRKKDKEHQKNRNLWCFWSLLWKWQKWEFKVKVCRLRFASETQILISGVGVQSVENQIWIGISSTRWRNSKRLLKATFGCIRAGAHVERICYGRPGANAKKRRAEETAVMKQNLMTARERVHAGRKSLHKDLTSGGFGSGETYSRNRTELNMNNNHLCCLCVTGLTLLCLHVVWFVNYLISFTLNSDLYAHECLFWIDFSELISN